MWARHAQQSLGLKRCGDPVVGEGRAAKSPVSAGLAVAIDKRALSMATATLH